MELFASERPPEPGASLTFDAEMKLTEFQMPPDQHLYKRVRLFEARTCGAGVSCFKAPGD